MKSKFVIVFSGLTAFSASVSGQATSALPDKVHSTYSVERMGDGAVRSDEMIQGVPLPGPNVIGDTYIHEEWRKGRILLYGKEKYYDGYTVRYDLNGQLLEVNTPAGIRIVDASRIRTFAMFGSASQDTSIYVNAKEFVTDGVQGFLKVIEDGPIALMSLPGIYVKRPDYNEALNVGSRDYKIYKKETLYYVISGQLKELPARKRDFLDIFPADKRNTMQQYLSEHKLDVTRQSDLAVIFRYYNSLQG